MGKVLRMQWVSKARAEEPVNPRWTPTSPSSYGKGGLWSALGLYLKKITMKEKGTAAARDIGKSVVATKVERLISKWSQKYPTPTITTGKDGTITIPAAATKSRTVHVMHSFDDGQQVLHGGGSVADHNRSAFEYEVMADAAGTYYLTAKFTTWHPNQDLMFSTSTSTKEEKVPVFYPLGYWNETQPIEVKLLKGKNILRFTRFSEGPLVIKEFFLFKSKPVIPPPNPHATPAPTPPLSSYIQLPEGKSCASQGIQQLVEKDCKTACEFLGYKYTGARARDFVAGCFSLVSGQWKGNCNYNTNASASSDSPDARAICARASENSIVIV